MTDDIDKLAKSSSIINKHFLGTYPADIIPYQGQKTCCWIWNIDRVGDEGQHWVGVWIEGQKLFFLTALDLV